MKTIQQFLQLLVFSLCMSSSLVFAADPIGVGRSLPLSGPLKSYSEAKRDGGDAYTNKINALGGVQAGS